MISFLVIFCGDKGPWSFVSARSPLVGHINSCVDGLSTIRACNAHEIVHKEFDKHQDLYSSATLMERLVFVAFAFYMDFISALFTIAIVARFLFFDHSKYIFILFNLSITSVTVTIS